MTHTWRDSWLCLIIVVPRSSVRFAQLDELFFSLINIMFIVLPCSSACSLTCSLTHSSMFCFRLLLLCSASQAPDTPRHGAGDSGPDEERERTNRQQTERQRFTEFALGKHSIAQTAWQSSCGMLFLTTAASHHTISHLPFCVCCIMRMRLSSVKPAQLLWRAVALNHTDTHCLAFPLFSTPLQFVMQDHVASPSHNAPTALRMSSPQPATASITSSASAQEQEQRVCVEAKEQRSDGRLSLSVPTTSCRPSSSLPSCPLSRICLISHCLSRALSSVCAWPYPSP